MNKFVKTVEETIITQHLIEKGDTILVAFSGGADSVCLLACLLELAPTMGFSLAAAHLNHGLRGEEADADEAFCRDLCKKWEISFHSRKVDVRSLAKDKGMGFEETGRMVRYSFFDELSRIYGFRKVATAHHLNDNVETVLMRMIRGTGMVGLAGIPYQNGAVIRPLLSVTRSDITDFLSERGLSYRTDSTNADTAYTRNRIRNNLIPELERDYNPSFQKTFSEQIRLYKSGVSYIKEEAGKLFDSLAFSIETGYGFPLEALRKTHPFLASSMLHNLVTGFSKGKEPTYQNIESMMHLLQTGEGRVCLPGGVLAEICHDVLYVRYNIPCLPIQPVALHPGERVKLSDGNVVSFELVSGIPAKIPGNVAYISPEAVSGKEIFIRSRKEGDRFCPTGMSGTKKLQDFFVDEKIPYFLRDSVPLLTVDDAVIWVLGYRGDRRYVAAKDQNQSFCVTIQKGDFR